MQVRDLGYIAQGGNAASDKKRASSGYMSSDRTNLEIYEDTSGVTLVKDLTYIQVCGSFVLTSTLS